MDSKQKTLKAPITFTGKGLHTGLNVTMKVLPAEANSGICFRRVDLPEAPVVEALGENVTDTARGTTIEKDGVRISTIEHIMASLWTLGVDNAMIEIDAPEVPIMDGSACEYAKTITETGLEVQAAERVYYRPWERVSFSIPEKGVEISIWPDEVYSVSVHIDYNSHVLGCQYATFGPGDDFATQIAPCRTFVFLHELEPLISANLIKGGDLDNAIVIVERPTVNGEIERLEKIFNQKDIKVNSRGYLNNLELRFTNEVARHKLLDILGDLALLGVRIKGRVMATRPGHFANTETVKALKKAMKRDAPRPRLVYDPNSEPVYDINGIRKLLPHRPPFLLVDRVIHIDHESVAGIKNVTMNEPFFVGHFPEEPVMPGVLIVEAMAQCGGILALHGIENPEDYSTYFMKIDGVKFKRKVVPGDTLQFELRLMEPIRRGIVLMEAKAYVAGQIATEAILMAQVAKTKA
ncbi:MAG: bifunctional UDP-3-O-[3-hydroxymyristoyl] N-acetylglucosamine deacetylase/3-hydroxyacyl-ACP dehydratase [Rikenellaceae bacterium]|jgi:UDP-3-O-[3-hydroxymyristoyl] N-acetylglucosamine deacetylase/3-hydroxyacyl-[acyl-carrier-protein] dehydratase|nr:bifunctional UDP-3-O-[3-hydroxymyristoyl] N-acetylglucosamine deacetylase/3-hydroxyacyl-ACP dehydratase [Rikenellaceae bacterium]